MHFGIKSPINNYKSVQKEEESNNKPFHCLQLPIKIFIFIAVDCSIVDKAYLKGECLPQSETTKRYRIDEEELPASERVHFAEQEEPGSFCLKILKIAARDQNWWMHLLYNEISIKLAVISTFCHILHFYGCS